MNWKESSDFWKRMKAMTLKDLDSWLPTSKASQKKQLTTWYFCNLWHSLARSLNNQSLNRFPIYFLKLWKESEWFGNIQSTTTPVKESLLYFIKYPIKLFKDARLKSTSTTCWMETCKIACKISMMPFNVVKNGEKFMTELLKLSTKTPIKSGISVQTLFSHPLKLSSKDAQNS